MTGKKNIATDTETFKKQNERLRLANTRLSAQNAAANEELKIAKAALIKIGSDYEARIRATHKMNIQDLLGCSDLELRKLTDSKSVEELDLMETNFQTAAEARKSPYSTPARTASIRTGSALVAGDENLTVGSLFGKTRAEILEMKGDF